MLRISSRQNPIVARFRATARGAGDDLILLDGPHLVADALAAGLGIDIAAIAAAPESGRQFDRLAELLTAAGATVVSVTAPVMDALSPVRSSTGIVALAHRPQHDRGRIFAGADPLALVAADIQDPGNVGAIVRVAEAAGASGVIVTDGSADPFGWKALRGSMGSALRLPTSRCASVDGAVVEARLHRCAIVAAVPRGGQSLFDVQLDGAIAVLIGGEGAGLPPGVIDAADRRLTIPMQSPVESLNAAVTAALILYEARRQRERRLP